MATSIRRGHTQHDVETSRQLAHLRRRDLRKVDGDRLPSLVVAQPAVDEVTVVAGVSLDVQLRGQQFLAALLHLEMNVRRAARIRHRLDGAKVILTGRAGGEPAEALEVL